MISISVICPVRNRKHLIGETLESLHRQSYAASEIIVVDDASDDGTPDEIAAQWPSVRLIRCDRNLGPGAARNRGLAVAQGTHVVFFDSDDLASDDYLAARVETALAKDADVVYGPWLPAWLDGGVCGHDGFVRQSHAPRLPPLEAFLRGWVLFLPLCLLRRKLILRAGGYPEHLRTGEDMLLLFRMLAQTTRVAHTSSSVMLVRQHPHDQLSASADGIAQRARDDLTLCEAVERELLANNAGPRREALRRAWRRRAAQSEISARLLGVRIGNTTDDPLSLVNARIDRLASRLRHAATARLFGHRIDGHFAPTRLNASHVAAINRLGYSARRLG